MAIPFDRNFDVPFGELVQLSPLVGRVLAPNPGPFTFKGTGVYIAGNGRTRAVIDPGPDMPAHLDALKKALAGTTVTHILVTHTHSDHSPAAKPLQAWCGAPIYAYGPHPSAYDGDVKMEEGGDRAFMPDVRVKDGEILKGEGFTFECIHTPGHTSNHMCFGLAEERALFSGDHVMGWSTTVVSPPDGDMTDYMKSLYRLRDRDDVVIYPTHGAPIRSPRLYLDALIEHRLEREAQVLAAIGDGLTTIPDMVARLYADVDKRLHPAAARSVEAHLVKLEREGRVAAEGRRYLLTK